MKRLSKLFRSLIGTVVVATGLLCVYALPSGAFNNLSTTGNANQTGGGGGGGSVGTLQQVLSAGNTANTSILLTGSGTLNIDGGVASGALFLDSSKNASSTSRIQVDGNTGSVTTSQLFVSSGGAIGCQSCTNSPKWSYTADTITALIGGPGRVYFTSTAFIPDVTVRPATADLHSLGTSSYKWANVHSVDGTYTGVVTSTRLVAGDGTSGSPSFSFSGNPTNGLWLNATNYPQLKGSTGVQIMANGSLYQYNSSAFYPETNNGRTLGDSTHYWSTFYGTTILGTTVTLGGSLTASSIYASTTAGSALPSLVVTGTTKFVNSSSTFFLSGASALVSDTAPIPTSTSVTVNGIPNQFYAFNATTTNCVYWAPGTLRGAWDATTITPTVSWTSASGSGDVVWRLRAQSLADGTNLGSTFTGEASYATGTFSLAYFRDVIPMTTLTVQNAAAYVPIRWELCREAGNSGDTFGGDAYAEMVMGKYYATNQSD